MTKTAPDLANNEARYFDRRAARQLALAEASPHPQAVAAHCALADRYMLLREDAERRAG